jgi:hypothetical protein
MLKYQKVCLFTFLAVLALSVTGKAQSKDYTFHTVFVYNFTKYIEWPTASPEIIIGVQGDNQAVMQAFEKMAQAKSDGDRKYIIRPMMKPEDAAACHVIFIPGQESDKLAAYAGKYAGTPKLIITEKEGLVKKGGVINFITVDGKLRFELNQAALDKTGLKVSTQLLSLAIVV